MSPARRFMIHGLQRAQAVVQSHPAVVCLALAGLVLAIDFAAGRELRFPLLYLVPIVLAAWTGQGALGYVLSVSLPLVRVVFENLWQTPESLSIEAVNAVLEACALAVYTYLASRQGVTTREMSSAISTKDAAMEHLRAFTRLTGVTLQGRSVSPGLAEGVARVFRSGDFGEISAPRAVAGDLDAELSRLDLALLASVRELEEARDRLAGDVGPGGGALVEVRLAMLGDPYFAEACRERVRVGQAGAERAVVDEIGRLEEAVQALPQAYLRERGADLRDMGRQILRHLAPHGEGAAGSLSALPPGTVLVADELLLSDALRTDLANLAAIVTERTGPASHVAILARVKRIPAVCDIRDATSLLATGDHLLVDGQSGTVTVAPTAAQGARFAARRDASALPVRIAPHELERPCVLRDGTEIALRANIGHPDEAVMVLEQALDGVGLYRSELLFLEAQRPPDLGAQAAAYAEVADMLDPRPVTIRTMDFGGDKLPRFALGSGDPALRSGLRGLAYSLAEKTLFLTQVRAIVRAAWRGNVSLLFPMVMGLADIREARALVAEAVEIERCETRLPIGAMIETPAGAFDIGAVLDAADFISIGTNDLAHSILALDRRSQAQDDVTVFLHPSVLRATEQVVQAANRRGVPVTVCGEVASDPTVACLLVGMGVRALSMNPFLAGRVRHTLQGQTLERAQALARDALSAGTPSDIRRVLSMPTYG